MRDGKLPSTRGRCAITGPLGNKLLGHFQRRGLYGQHFPAGEALPAPRGSAIRLSEFQPRRSSCPRARADGASSSGRYGAAGEDRENARRSATRAAALERIRVWRCIEDVGAGLRNQSSPTTSDRIARTGSWYGAPLKTRGHVAGGLPDLEMSDPPRALGAPELTGLFDDEPLAGMRQGVGDRTDPGHGDFYLIAESSSNRGSIEIARGDRRMARVMRRQSPLIITAARRLTMVRCSRSAALATLNGPSGGLRARAGIGPPAGAPRDPRRCGPSNRA